MKYQFLHCAKEWSKLSEKIRNIDSLNKFKSSVLNFIRSRENSIFAIHDINVVKLLNRLTLNYNYLNEHKFQHNLNGMIYTMCSCGVQPEKTLHYLLHYDLSSTCRLELFNDIYNLKTSSKNYSEDNLLKDNLVSVFGDFLLKANFPIKRIHNNSSIFKKTLAIWQIAS